MLYARSHSNYKIEKDFFLLVLIKSFSETMNIVVNNKTTPNAIYKYILKF